MNHDTCTESGRPLTDAHGQPSEVDLPDFVAFPALINNSAAGLTRERIPAYRQCFELNAGKWEGFVARAEVFS
jgi:hypothetical protein